MKKFNYDPDAVIDTDVYPEEFNNGDGCIMILMVMEYVMN